MRIAKLAGTAVVTTLLAACGGGGGGGGSGDGTGGAGMPVLAAATSQLCDELRGLEAIYWDFINGVPRGDLPSTAFTIPFDIDFAQSPYQNSTSLLLGFSVPLGWTATDAVDVSGFAIPGTVAGADLIRNDDRAVWRYMFNARVQGPFTAASILQSEINTGLAFLGNPGPVEAECEIDAQQNGPIGLESVAARVIRAGDVTIMARTHVTIVSGIGAFYDGFVSAGLTAEFPVLINDIFVPMITQLYGGGSGPDDQACSDGQDNDGDGQTDFPDDPQCQNPQDNSEAQN